MSSLWAEKGPLFLKVIPFLQASCSRLYVVSFPFSIPRLAIPNIRHRPESSGATGLQSLEKACVFTKPEGAGFDQRLWEGWAEEGGEEEEEEATLRGEDGPSDEPALPTPGTSQPAGESQPGPLEAVCPASSVLCPHSCWKPEAQSEKEHTLQNAPSNGLLITTTHPLRPLIPPTCQFWCHFNHVSLSACVYNTQPCTHALRLRYEANSHSHSVPSLKPSSWEGWARLGERSGHTIMMTG